MDLSAVSGLLAHLNQDEYKEILNDDDKFDELFKDIPQVVCDTLIRIKDWEAEKDMMIASNRSLAEFNLNREPVLLEAKQKVLDKSAIGEEICKSVQEKLSEYKSKSAGISLDTTLALLETSAAESEEKSEGIAQKFIDGELDIEKFLEDFTKERISMHLRKVKVDKMMELMRNKKNAQSNLFSNTQGLPYPAYASSAYPGYANPMPYPRAPMNMPMPGMYGNHF